MLADPFLDLCKEQGYEKEALLLFDEARAVSRKYLESQMRLAGDSFFDHNMRVAITLIENKAEPEVVIVGLLHGVLHYCSEKEVLGKFGETVLQFLREVNEIRRAKLKNEALESEALRKVILTALKDVRVVLIKLANKIDNLDSIHVFPPKEQEKIAREVLDIYAPLALRLGMDKMRVQLEDMAFKIINPRKYSEIFNYLEESRQDREKAIATAIKKIEEVAYGMVPIIKIKGRPKHIYSIYKKMINRGVRLDQQYDLFGVRAIVETEKKCYTLLGLLHEKFDPIEGRLKDYIFNPKPNFYRSLHTGIKFPDGRVVEVQIRTEEMEEFAEEGIAAHWRYKGIEADELFEKKISWLRGVLELKKQGQDFVDAVKVDVFGDKIHCYTPKGDVKELPIGSSVLDFAYAIHDEIGNKCIGGRVNGKFVPLRYKLNKEDVVEILTNKKQKPRRNWIKIVSSAKARQKIRRELKNYDFLPAFHFRKLKPVEAEDKGILVEAEDYPKAVCVLAKCCDPLPGEEIVGVATKKRVISIHKDDCRAALKLEERWIAVRWKDVFTQKIKFFVHAQERSGVLADLLHTIARTGFETKVANVKLLGKYEVECSFIIIPRKLEHLERLVRIVLKVKGVRKVFFD